MATVSTIAALDAVFEHHELDGAAIALEITTPELELILGEVEQDLGIRLTRESLDHATLTKAALDLLAKSALGNTCDLQHSQRVEIVLNHLLAFATRHLLKV